MTLEPAFCLQKEEKMQSINIFCFRNNELDYIFRVVTFRSKWFTWHSSVTHMDSQTPEKPTKPILSVACALSLAVRLQGPDKQQPHRVKDRPDWGEISWSVSRLALRKSAIVSLSVSKATRPVPQVMGPLATVACCRLNLWATAAQDKLKTQDYVSHTLLTSNFSLIQY